MIKKTKDAASIIAENIKKSLEFNKTHTTQYSRINLSSVEISRGLMNYINNKDDFKNAVCAELNLEYGDGFEWKTQDNEDMGCYLFIRF